MQLINQATSYENIFYDYVRARAEYFARTHTVMLSYVHRQGWYYNILRGNTWNFAPFQYWVRLCSVRDAKVTLK